MGTQLERITFVHSKIQEKGFVRVDEITQYFETCNKTVYNDIRFMRESLEIPIEYNKSKKGYIYTAYYDKLNFGDDKMLMGLAFIKSLSKSFFLLPQISDSLVDYLTDCLSTGLLSKEYKELSNRIFYSTSEVSNYDEKILSKVIESFRKKSICRINYTDRKNKTSVRDIEPLQLVNYQGDWHLYAYCYKRKAIRVFVLSRIKECFVTSERFTLDYDNDWKYSLINSRNSVFGKFAATPLSSNIKKVIIRFYGDSYYSMKNKILHEKQIRRINSDTTNGEYVEFEIPVVEYEEIIMEVMKHGSNAEVISPKPFKELWLQKIEELYKRYLGN